jgi:maleamate amidohydrolase
VEDYRRAASGRGDAPLADDYRRAGFGGRLEPGDRPALLVVDFVRAYLDRAPPLYAGVEAVLASAARVLEAARAGGVPVAFTTVRYQAGGADGGLFYRKVPALEVFQAGSPLAELPEVLAPGRGRWWSPSSTPAPSSAPPWPPA